MRDVASTKTRGNPVIGWLLFLVIAAAIAVSGRPVAEDDPAMRTDIREVTTQEAKAMIDAGALVVDVRERAVSAGLHLPNALRLPQDVLVAGMKEVEADLARPVVVYCGDGSRLGPDAAAALNQAGYQNAVNLKHGIDGWRAAGLPTASN